MSSHIIGNRRFQHPHPVFIVAMAVAIAIALAFMLVGCDGGEDQEAMTSGTPLTGAGSFSITCQNTVNSGNSTTNIDVDCGDRSQGSHNPTDNSADFTP